MFLIYDWLEANKLLAPLFGDVSGSQKAAPDTHPAVHLSRETSVRLTTTPKATANDRCLRSNMTVKSPFIASSSSPLISNNCFSLNWMTVSLVSSNRNTEQYPTWTFSFFNRCKFKIKNNKTFNKIIIQVIIGFLNILLLF